MVQLLQVQQAPVMEFLTPTKSTTQVSAGSTIVLNSLRLFLIVWVSRKAPCSPCS